MRKGFLVGTALLVACLCGLSVQAQTYRDECRDHLPNEVKQYGGSWQAVGNFGDLAGWPTCGDATALSVVSREAYAEYHIGGAETVRVELYADFGTFALATWTESGQAFQLGSEGALAPAPILRCLYDRVRDVVFLRVGEILYTLRNEPEGLRFRPAQEVLLAAEGFYGLHLSCSADGIHYTALEKAPLRKARSQAQEGFQRSYYAETYEAALPQGTLFIRVALRGFGKIPGADGWKDYARGAHLLLLSRVEIAGETLQLGSPPEPPIDSSSSSSSSTASVREQKPHSKRGTHNRREIALGETLTPGVTYHANQPTPPEQPIPPASSRVEKAPALSRGRSEAEAPFSEPEKERLVIPKNKLQKGPGIAVVVGSLGVVVLLLLALVDRRRRW